MRRPVLLDLFCGAGGAAMGYHRAGFDVVGVDNVPQPNFPFEFIQADISNPDVEFDLDFWGCDAIHASPPCQRYSHLKGKARAGHPDLVGYTRDLIRRQTDGDGNGILYVIENVVGAPMRDPARLCGSSFGCTVSTPLGMFELRRHRLFEASRLLLAPACCHAHPVLGVYGDISKEGRPNNAVRGRKDRKAVLAEAKELMGIDWMTGPELSQAIPPAYTEFIGRQLMQHIGRTT